MGSIKWNLRAISLLLALAHPAVSGGQFKSGLGKGDSLKASLPLPPEVRIGSASLSVEVRDALPARAGRLDAISGSVRSALERSFRGGAWQIAPVAGESVIRVSLTEFVPPMSRIIQQNRVIQVPRVAPNGRVLVDAYGRPLLVNRRVVVDHWTARGRIGFRAEVVEPASGVVIDSFTGGARFENQADVRVNGVAQVDLSQIPTSEQIESGLVADLANQFARRYNPGVEEVEIPLSVAEELRAGNTLAKSRDYADAAQSWKSAVPRKNESIGDKVHNQGCIHEVLAYGLLLESRGSNFDGVSADLQKALEAYQSALREDPKEKYFQQAIDRVQRAFGVVERFRAVQKNYEAARANGVRVQQSAADAVREASSATTAETTETPTTKEEEYRELVKARLTALTGPPTADLATQLEKLGVAAYGLDAARSRKIFDQEVQQMASAGHSAKLVAYRETFQALLQDGQISADDRRVLDTLASNLGLTKEQVQRAEANSAK
jgi:tetratricopeptide (TPR) repeat protein